MEVNSIWVYTVVTASVLQLFLNISYRMYVEKILRMKAEQDSRTMAYILRDIVDNHKPKSEHIAIPKSEKRAGYYERTDETRKRQSEALKRHHAEKRARNEAPPT